MKVVWATNKFYTRWRGDLQTHELWLPFDLTDAEMEEFFAEFRQMVNEWRSADEEEE
jgi:hypothetical protein